MHSLLTLMQTSITYLMNSGYHGSTPRPYPSVMLFHIWALFGISQHAQSRSPWRRSANIVVQLRTGRRNHNTPWQRCRSSMASCSTPPWWCQPGEHTSPTWRPCSPFSTIVLSCHTPHPTTHLMILFGGPNSSTLKPCLDPSQAQLPSKTWTLSQMPAQALALPLPSARIGRHGNYSQVGRLRGETSGGQKQLASSS